MAIYNKTIWENNLPPSIDDYNLGKMEEGIYQNSLRVEDLITLTTKHTNDIAKLNDDLGKLGTRMSTAENDIKTLKGNITSINTALGNKADKSNTYTKSEIGNLLSGYTPKSQFDSLSTQVSQIGTQAGSTATNTYTKTQSDGRYLKKTGDTATGNYTFSNNVTVSETLNLSKTRMNFGNATLYIQSSNPGGKAGDVWIKNG